MYIVYTWLMSKAADTTTITNGPNHAYSAYFR